MRVFRPLPPEHPLIIDGTICPICRQTFKAGERTTLAPVREAPQQGAETVPAIPLHATCALEGMKTRHGTITRIKNGDGSPFPVETTQGQFTLAEMELE